MHCVLHNHICSRPRVRGKIVSRGVELVGDKQFPSATKLVRGTLHLIIAYFHSSSGPEAMGHDSNGSWRNAKADILQVMPSPLLPPSALPTARGPEWSTQVPSASPPPPSTAHQHTAVHAGCEAAAAYDRPPPSSDHVAFIFDFPFSIFDLQAGSVNDGPKCSRCPPAIRNAPHSPLTPRPPHPVSLP